MDSEEVRHIKALIKGIKAYQELVAAYRDNKPKGPENIYNDIEKAEKVIGLYEDY